MDIAYAEEAADKLDFYDEHDETLAEAFDKVLQRLRADPSDSRFRTTYLRPPGAYVIHVRVPGRDQDYYVFWSFDTDDDNLLWVKYAGPGPSGIA